MIVWAVYETGDAGSPYKIFFVWVALYAAFFFGPWAAGVHVAAMLSLYGAALIEMGDQTTTPGLHWVLTASALILIAVAVQALTVRLARLVERLTEIGPSTPSAASTTPRPSARCSRTRSSAPAAAATGSASSSPRSTASPP
jgi:hypothetical protein